ncbi:MAG: hypothetical protein WC700_09880 [Gemmatimonadaceae bacterium]
MTIPERAAAQSASALQVELRPDSIVLGAAASGTVFVIVRNPAPQAVRDVRVSWIAADSITVVADTSVARLIGPSDSWSARLTVRRGRNVATRADILVRVNYLAQLPANGSSRQSSFVALHVVPRALVDAQQIVEVQEHFGRKALKDNQTDTVHLILRNKVDVPVDVGPIRAAAPSFIQVDAGMTVRLQPHETQVVVIGLKASNRVRSGERGVVFFMPVHWPTADGIVTATAIFSRELTIGVVGESEVLTLLAVPSFLVLPGFLILMTIGLLWRIAVFGRGRQLTFKPPLLEFWVIAVTLSGAMAWAFGLAGDSYLDSYGVTDIARVWMWSLTIAVAFVAMDALTHMLYQRARSMLYEPNRHDDPPATLEKLSRRGFGLELERLAKPDGKKGYALQAFENAADVWVAPPIRVKWLGPDHEAAESAFEAAVNAKDLMKAAAVLKKAAETLQADVGWSAETGLHHPEKWKTETLKPEGPKPILVP